MINQRRNEDRRDRSGPRKLGQKADALIVREPRKPAKSVAPVTLAECEERIKASFLEMAEALSVIKSKHLYREAGYSQFDEYCREVWGHSARRAYQLLAADALVKSLPKSVNKLFTNEGQARAIAAVPKERRVEVLKAVAKDGPVTAKAVRERVAGSVIEIESESLIRTRNVELSPDVVRLTESPVERHCATCTCTVRIGV